VYLLVIGVVLSVLVALGVNQDQFDIDNFDTNDDQSSDNTVGGPQ